MTSEKRRDQDVVTAGVESRTVLPSNRFLVLVGLGLVPAALAVFDTAFFALALGYLALCLGLLAGELLFGPRPDEIRADRLMPGRFSVGEPDEIQIRLRNHSRRKLHIEAQDTPPAGWEPRELPQSVTLSPHQEGILTYEVTPRARGRERFGDIHLRLQQAPGLAVRQMRVSAGEEARVYPDLREVTRYELMARRSRLEEFGIHRARLVGRGTEFERIRDYTPDDEYRRIDWKATARRRRPMTRVYEVERSQNVFIVLDAGRMMAARVGKMSKLDYAVNAALILAHVAVRAGDRVGLMIVSDTVDAHLPFGKGAAWIQRCVDLLYGVQARLCHVDYRGALEQVAINCKRRALVTFFTDLVDEETSSELVTYMRLLRPVHLPLVVTLQDNPIVHASRKSVESAPEMFEKQAALELLAERKRILERLHRMGALVLDAPPEELSVRVINRYLELKARQLL